MKKIYAAEAMAIFAALLGVLEAVWVVLYLR
jgi:hypothetical protein